LSAQAGKYQMKKTKGIVNKKRGCHGGGGKKKRKKKKPWEEKAGGKRFQKLGWQVSGGETGGPGKGGEDLGFEHRTMGD